MLSSMNLILFLNRNETPADVWEVFYGSPVPSLSCVGKNSECDLTTKVNQIYIYESQFEDDTDGSVIIDKDGIKFMHSACFFENCTSNNYGGTIFFSSDGPIIQRRFCAVHEYSTIYKMIGSFSYTSLSYGNTNDNVILEGTVSRCVDGYCYDVIFMTHGNIGISHSNISNNDIPTCPGLDIENVNEAFVNFSTLENNHAKESICFNHYIAQTFYECCNFIKNTQEMAESGIFHTSFNNITIKNSTFHKNNKNGKTFSSFGGIGNITLIFCNIDSYSTSSASLFTFGNTFTDSYSILSHLSTYECIAVHRLHFTAIINRKEPTIDIQGSSFYFAFFNNLTCD